MFNQKLQLMPTKSKINGNEKIKLKNNVISIDGGRMHSKNIS